MKKNTAYFTRVLIQQLSKLIVYVSYFLIILLLPFYTYHRGVFFLSINLVYLHVYWQLLKMLIDSQDITFSKNLRQLISKYVQENFLLVTMTLHFCKYCTHISASLESLQKLKQRLFSHVQHTIWGKKYYLDPYFEEVLKISGPYKSFKFLL